MHTHTVDPPVIDTQPSDEIISEGGSVTFTVVVNSTSAVSYQWSFDGVEIENATESTYTIASVVEANYGSYVCRVANEDGSVDSRVALLSSCKRE